MDRQQIARRLEAGLSSEPENQAATRLLIQAAHGIWLTKLAGWDQYLSPSSPRLAPDGLSIDWYQLRDDFVADEHAWEEFRRWTESYAGRTATDAEYEQHREATVPTRPWHGASTSELVILRIALEIAPGGLLGDGVPYLDHTNAGAVGAAFDATIASALREPSRPQR
jgi:hypothetical protein